MTAMFLWGAVCVKTMFFVLFIPTILEWDGIIIMTGHHYIP